jgi:BlaI family transcriptional regulator, penicillinase repressor
MPKRSLEDLSRRERQIMNVIYRLGEGLVSDVRDSIPDAPSYSTVRALLVLLESKGYLKHRKAGRAYVYRPVIGLAKTRYSALKQLVHTFFDGSVENVVAALLGTSAKLSQEELDKIEKLIRLRREENENDSD